LYRHLPSDLLTTVRLLLLPVGLLSLLLLLLLLMMLMIRAPSRRVKTE